MKTVGKNCIVYSVKKSAGYRGCGKAFAIIDNEEVIKLTYVDDLVDSLTDCDMGSENLDHPLRRNTRKRSKGYV